MKANNLLSNLVIIAKEFKAPLPPFAKEEGFFW